MPEGNWKKEVWTIFELIFFDLKLEEWLRKHSASILSEL